MEKCKPHQELNPFTNKCVIKCAEGKKRYTDVANKKFSCLDPIKNKDKFLEQAQAEQPQAQAQAEQAQAPNEVVQQPEEQTPNEVVQQAQAQAEQPQAQAEQPQEQQPENIQLNIVEKTEAQPEPIQEEEDDEQKEKIRKQKLNNFKMDIEMKERAAIIKNETANSYLYPNLNDPLFNIKITEKKEFNDARYNGEIVEDIDKEAEVLCNAEFELAPHQLFVRNFLSFQTPYNSLLLYHGLGSGKTCSAISVAEEMRDYLMQMNIDHEIIVIASPNVQENFRLQLFDERKLKLVDGLWNIRACTGNKFLKEINPMNMKGLTKENVVGQVKKIINTYYSFMGYVEFANDITKKSAVDSEIKSTKQKNMVMRQNLRKHYNNRLIIIDEVHNIRIADDNNDKKRVAMELFKLVENVENLRLLMLSATPMYNSYKEIIWLVNLMNMNDHRPTIETRDVFNSDGSFKTSKTGEEIGKELLERKATGYISFVRGENPYTFPYRLWPYEFAEAHTFKNANITYPTQQLNGKEIIQNLDILSVYLVETGSYQQRGYSYIINKLKEGALSSTGKELPSFENMESFGYTMLQRPLEALNMIYPHPKLAPVGTVGTLAVDAVGTPAESTPAVAPKISLDELVGKVGLNRLMSYQETSSSRYDFEYKDSSLRIFAPNEIGKYSGKIKSICDRVMNSTGVVLIYSQYIDGGVLPIALALEELGFTRAGNVKSLLKTPSTDKIDAITFKTRAENDPAAPFHPAKYVMITGDKPLSPNNVEDIALATNVDNKDGTRVKVVFISQAGAEGLDLKFIRQVHILEPWYNMNRIEQIIGRAVRTCSHKDLPFNKRNVEIYLYGSLMENRREEAADLYVYRLAELKAVQIGNVSRVLKEIAVDCILNYEQIGFSVENMKKTVTLELSSGGTLNYAIGDKPYSSTCDYMEKCQYICRPFKEIGDADVKLDTYNEQFIMMNTDKIIHKIRSLIKERFFYKKTELITLINAIKFYPLVQINAALDQLVEDKNEYITDKYGRVGNLVNIGDMYLFQPLELTNKNISIYDRSVPIDFKHDNLSFIIPDASASAPTATAAASAPTATAATMPNTFVESDLTILVREMKENYKVATTKAIVERGEDNWYKFCSLVIEDLEKNEITSRDNLLNTLVAHIVDELSYEKRMLLMNNLDTIVPETDFTNRVKSYINSDIITNKGIVGMIVNKNGERQILVKMKEGEWQPAQPEDIEDLKPKLAEIIGKFLPVKSRLNSLIGFMTNFKKDYIIFKIKDLNKPRQKGARCDQSGKKEAIKMLNTIIGEEKYNKESEVTQKQVCVLQEFMMRIYNIEMKNGVHWFLTPGEAALINIEQIKN